jgi:hypothetical protein
VLVIKVDRLDAEALQARIAAGLHVFGFATDAAQTWIRFIAQDSKFRREENLIALPSNRFADQDLVVAIAIGVGRVEKIYSQLDGTVNCCDRFFVVARAVKFRHAHAAQSQFGDQRAVLSQFSPLHDLLQFWGSLVRCPAFKSGYRAPTDVAVSNCCCHDTADGEGESGRLCWHLLKRDAIRRRSQAARA